MNSCFQRRDEIRHPSAVRTKWSWSSPTTHGTLDPTPSPCSMKTVSTVTPRAASSLIAANLMLLQIWRIVPKVPALVRSSPQARMAALPHSVDSPSSSWPSSVNSWYRVSGVPRSTRHAASMTEGHSGNQYTLPTVSASSIQKCLQSLHKKLFSETALFCTFLPNQRRQGSTSGSFHFIGRAASHTV